MKAHETWRHHAFINVHLPFIWVVAFAKAFSALMPLTGHRNPWCKRISDVTHAVVQTFLPREREGGRANYGVVWGTSPTTRHLHTAVMWRTISVTGSMNPKLVIIVMSRPGVFLAFSTWAQYIRYYCADSEWLPYSRVMIFARYMQFLCNMQCIFWYFKYFRVLFVIFVWKCLYLLQMLARCTSSLINLRRWQDLFADLISNNCR